jgi:hypothetical protein
MPPSGTYNVREDGMYGLDRELAEKAAAKYDPKLEQEAREWIGAVTGEPLGEGSIHEVLKSGVVLCNLLRTLQPEIIKAPSKMAAPFKQMENIGNYLAACAKLGQPDFESFQTVDLFEGNNMLAVVGQIHSLGRLAQKLPGYAGPSLGVKEAEKNVRHFTEEQLQEAKGTATFLASGSVRGTQAKAELAGKQIIKTAQLEKEGLGKGGEQTLVGAGSVRGTQAKAELSGKQIVKTSLDREGLGTSGEVTFGRGASRRSFVDPEAAKEAAAGVGGESATSPSAAGGGEAGVPADDAFSDLA